ncbi:pseudouridine synthase [Chitinophaga agrisoli]|nr:pseudouridine synthase [Chitinophaga agrisoli]
MKKNKPAATKGFSPFKENKRSTDKRNSEGERPARGVRKDDDKPARTFKRDDDKGGFRSEDKRPARRADGKPARTFKRDDDKGGFRSEDKRPARRADGKPARTFKRDDDKGGFRSEDKRPARKTAGDRPARPAAKRDNDDSSFHGDFQPERKGPVRETPSGFNRQKFFDRANDRFADKQARKTAPRKSRDADSFNSKGKRSKEGEETLDGEGMPLNKYIAHCGVCSRRKAVDYIKEGKVTVNDQQVLEPAFKVTDKDQVKVANKRITIQKNLVYILLNKPKGYITTTDDPEGRQTVMELIADATDERVFPVGRLDRNTSGLLLLTNDGELAQKLAHPKHNIKKIYQVELDKPLTKADFDKIINGVTLEDGLALVDALGYVDPKDKKQVGIEIHSGKNRIVRRIFEHLEYKVEKLDRVMYAGLTKKNVNRGRWRMLSDKEIILLKHFK